MPELINRIRQRNWKPNPLPFLNYSSCEKEILLTENDSESQDMTIDKFWKLIEIAKEESKDNDKLQVKILTEHLSALSAPEIIAFQDIFKTLHEQSRRDYLWSAAKIIKGFCSDDSFEYFRAWLIAQGQAIFNNALKDPETLTNVIHIGGIHSCSLEEIIYVARYAYENKTKNAIPNTSFKKLNKNLIPVYEITACDFPALSSKFSQQEEVTSSESSRPWFTKAFEQVASFLKPDKPKDNYPFDLGFVTEAVSPQALRVQYAGTNWRATTANKDTHFSPGDRVRIVGRVNITLLIEPISFSPLSSDDK